MADSTVDGQWIERMFATIDASDWSELPAFFHPAVVYERPGYEPFVGRDRVMRFYREERVIVRGRHTLEGVVVADGKAAAWGRIDAVHADGSPIAHAFSDVYVLAQDAVKLRRSHFFVPAV